MSRNDDRELQRLDARARRVAQLEFARPLVLEAGAGTGKTTVLVARVLAWCLGPGWERARAELSPRAGEVDFESRVAAHVLGRVVAITFTEAASAEMASRIEAGLRGIERGEPVQGLLPDALPGGPDADAARRARALRAGLDHLVVHTIHAWCRRLLAGHPLEAGVHPRLEVDAEAKLEREMARDAVEQRLGEAYAAGDPAALGLASRGSGPGEIEDELCALLENGVPARALSDPPSPRAIQALAARLRDALRSVDAALSGVAGLSGKGLEVAECVGRSLARADAGAALAPSELGALATWLGEEWDESRLNRLRAWKRGTLTGGEAAALGAGGAALAAAAEGLDALLRHVARLDLEGLELARPLFRDLLADVEARMRARGAATFSTLLARARDLLVEHPDVAARVRRGIDQLLVDEFQDTDRHQCDIVRAVALSGPESERPGLFLVGDPKQSIYGWRSADLAAYDGFVRDVTARGGARERLCVSYRSVAAVLDEVERAIAPNMIEREGVQPAFQRLVPYPDNADRPGLRAGRAAPVEYWVSALWDDEADAPGYTSALEAAELEATALARDLRALHDEHGVGWRDIGVLFRSRGDWEIYLAALRAAGIPFAVEGDRSYYRRREVIDAAALVRCVLDPNDVLALLGALRSVAIGVPDVALVPLWARELPARAAALGDEGDAARLSELAEIAREVAAALPRGIPGLDGIRGWETGLAAGLEAIAALRRCFASEPADVFVERLRAAFLLEASEAARYLGAWRVANLERFFRTLAEDLARGESVSAVLRRLRHATAEEERASDGRPQEVVEDAVHVLTIHGAKGLGFRCVYAMQLHKGSAPRPDAAVRAGEVLGATEYRLLSMPTPGFDLVETERAGVERAERVRTLYVAMTRAKERLVLAGLWPGLQNRGARGTHVELLASRLDPAPDLAELAAEAARAGSGFADAHGVRWAFPALLDALLPAARPARTVRDASGLPDARTAAGRIARLDELSRAARERQGLPFGGRASDEARHGEERGERLDRGAVERVARDGAEGIGADVGRAIGTAVHRALEELDLAGDPAAVIDRAQPVLEASLRDALAPGELAGATAGARDVWSRFAAGPLHARLRELGDRVVARELPVLLAPREGDAGPPEAAAYVAGAIDLVYRDPATDELVIVDYKTDRPADAGALEARTRAYARQGAVYQRALRNALSLAYTPRFEIWYVAVGRVVAPASA